MQIPTVQDVKAMIDRISPISDDLWVDFASTISVKQVAKGAVLQSCDTPVTHAWIVAKGLLRSYNLTVDGDEVTMGFFPQGTICGSYACYLGKKNSQDTVEALEESFYVAVDISQLEALVAVHLEWCTFLRKVTEHYLVTLYDRSTNLLRMSAAERLARFKETRSDIVQRVSQRHLASYLGISREALNRLMRES